MGARKKRSRAAFFLPERALGVAARGLDAVPRDAFGDRLSLEALDAPTLFGEDAPPVPDPEQDAGDAECFSHLTPDRSRVPQQRAPCA